MAKQISLFCVTLIALLFSAKAQTVDLSRLVDSYGTAVTRQVYDVARHVNLTTMQQVKLAEAFIKENGTFIDRLAQNEGFLSAAAEKEIARMHDKALARILDDEQLRQYYRGIFDKEAGAEASSIANKFRKEYGITDQNWKFIRIAFYKIGLESRVNNKLLPAGQARKANEKIHREMLQTIEDKGDIRINDDMTLTVLKPFDPNTLHK